MENSEIIKAALTILPAVIMPLVLWYLNYDEKSSARQQLSDHIKRLELLEKLRDFDLKLPAEGSLLKESLFKTEINRIQNFLCPELDEHDEKQLLNFDQLPKVRRLFLLFRPVSHKVFLIQSLFFFVLSDFLLASLRYFCKAYSHQENVLPGYGWILITLFLAIDIMLLIITSASANQLQRRKLLKKV